MIKYKIGYYNFTGLIILYITTIYFGLNDVKFYDSNMGNLYVVVLIFFSVFYRSNLISFCKFRVTNYNEFIVKSSKTVFQNSKYTFLMVCAICVLPLLNNTNYKVIIIIVYNLIVVYLSFIIIFISLSQVYNRTTAFVVSTAAIFISQILRLIIKDEVIGSMLALYSSFYEITILKVISQIIVVIVLYLIGRLSEKNE